MRNNLIKAIALVAGTLAFSAVYAADIVIVPQDDQGEGFNNDSEREPVGGNPGETLGEQRLIAAQYAADIVGRRIGSTVQIRIGADWQSQGCTLANATLASAGATTLVANFPGNPRSDTFYPVALANRFAGQDLDPGRMDIGATFNSDLDNPLRPDCLGGADWYYGLDGNPPDGDLDFVETATHEFVHGVGFATFTNLATGEFPSGEDQNGNTVGPFPDIYAVFIRDLLFGDTWPDLTQPERQQSATNDENVVWDGASTTSNAPPTLSDGTSSGRVQLYAPNTLMQGSSISHWEDSVTPNVLMEPFADEGIDVLDGIDLATCLLQDIGWSLINDARCPDRNSAAPPLPGTGGSNSGGGDSNSDANGGDSGGGGGGCTLAATRTTDPLLPLLLLSAALMLGRGRRFSARRATSTRICHKLEPRST